MYQGAKSAHKEMLKLMGEDFALERGGAVRTVRGHRNSKENYIGFFPEEDVQPGDILRSTVSNKIYYIVDTDDHTMEGKLLQVRAIYETDTQRNKREAADKAQPPTYSFSGPVYGSIVGSQENATLTNTFDFRQLELEIDKRGGEDREALHAMVAEVQAALANPTIDRGMLGRFSELMEKHSWISATFAQAMLQWAVGATGVQ